MNNQEQENQRAVAFSQYQRMQDRVFYKLQLAQAIYSRILEKRTQYINPKPSCTKRLERKLFGSLADLYQDLHPKVTIYRKKKYPDFHKFGEFVKAQHRPALAILYHYLNMMREFSEEMKYTSCGEHARPETFEDEMLEEMDVD